MKLIIPMLFTLQVCNAQNFENYLQQNKATVQLTEQNNFAIANSDFKENNIFLFGENHGSAQPHVVDLLLFKKLHKEMLVRHYIAEVDPTKAWMLNKYLKDGNEAWLQKVFASWQKEGMQWANTSNYNKYKKLHEFYKSQPKNKKFTIIGIDVLQDFSLLREFCNYFVKNKPSKISLLNDLVAAVDTTINKDKKKVSDIARAIKQEMLINTNYKTALKNDFALFDLFIKNTGYLNNKMYRDSVMYRSFDDAITTLNLKDKKMYGFIGFYHTLQTSYEKSYPFASHVKKNYGKVISFQMLAIDCKVLLPYDNSLKKVMPAQYVESLRKQNPDFPKTDVYIPYDLSNDNTMMKVDGIDQLKKQTVANTITLFKLNAENSPYAKGKKLAEVTGFQTLKLTNEQAYTLEAFQYVILFRNSSFGIPLLK